MNWRDLLSLISGRQPDNESPQAREPTLDSSRDESVGRMEFLLSLRSAEVLRRPKSLAYLQSLKWVAQVKEKVR